MNTPLSYQGVSRFSREAILNMRDNSGVYFPRLPISWIQFNDEHSSILRKHLNFQEQIVALLKHDSVNGKGTQFVLKGMPSAGKSTELRRIGVKLLSKLDKSSGHQRNLIHVSSVQNFSSQGANISNAEGLWRLLLRCHEGAEIAGSGFGLQTFMHLHTIRDVNPIFLIDTLDLLAYGTSGKEKENISNAWVELMDEFKKAKATVLWSVRPVEFEDLKSAATQSSGPIHEIIEIDLPHIRFSGITSHLKQKCQQELPLKGGEIAVVAALVQQFPIISRFLPNGHHNAEVSKSIVRQIIRYAKIMKDSEPYVEVHPLTWVMKKLDANIPTDWCYRVLKDEIQNELLSVYPDYTPETFETLFRNRIENPFFNLADESGHIFSNRLSIPLSLHYHEGQIPEVVLIVHHGQKIGLFEYNERNQVLTFTHQLFAEFAVYLNGKFRIKKYALNEGSEVHQLLANIPSCQLRNRVLPNLPSTSYEGNLSFIDWFAPFFGINDGLRKSFQSNMKEFDTLEWKKAADFARRAVETQRQIQSNAQILNSAPHEDERNRVSEDKKTILARHRQAGSRPLVINGPAGTGKSYLGVPFIIQRVEEQSQLLSEMGDKKIMASFLTLSDKLSESFKRDYEERFAGSGTQYPVELRTKSVDELLQEMERDLENDSRLSPQLYQHRLLSEGRFVRALESSQVYYESLGTYSPYSLWAEFTGFILDDKGEAVALHDYINRVRGGIDGNRSLFSADFTVKNMEKKAEKFYTLVQQKEWLDPKKFRTRGKVASRLLDLIEQDLSHQDEDVRNRMMEQIDPYRSDILIIDEVQDLDSAVLTLSLFLHRGDPSDVAIMGDDEQTLDLVEFDWGSIQRRVGSNLTKYSRKLPNVSNLKLWASVNFSDVIESRHLLQEVQRNVEPIVEFIRRSWTQSVSEKLPEPSGGTAEIIAGDIPKRRMEENNYPEHWGVHWDHERVSEDDFVKFCNLISRSSSPVAVIMPNHQVQKAVEPLLEKEEIDLVLWNPVSIKGLEYNTVVAVSPWSIDRNKLPLEYASWDDYIKEVSDRSNDFESPHKLVEELNRFGLQRRRHANVMLSRPKNTLFIVHLDHEMYLETGSPNIDDNDTVTNIKSLDDIKRQIDTSVKTADEHDTLERVLSDIIESNRELSIVGKQAAQILKIKEEAKETVSEKIQFKILKDFCKIPESKGIDFLYTLLFHSSYRCIVNKKPDSYVELKDLKMLQNKFYTLAQKFEFKEKGEVETQERFLLYNPGIVKHLISLHNTMIDVLTRGLPAKGYKKHRDAIDNFIANTIFSGPLEPDDPNIWVNSALNLDPLGRQLRHEIRDQERLSSPESSEDGVIYQLVDMMKFFHDDFYLNRERTETQGKLKTTRVKKKSILIDRGLEITKDDNVNNTGYAQYFLPYNKVSLHKELNLELEDESLTLDDFWDEGKSLISKDKIRPDHVVSLRDVFFKEKNSEEFFQNISSQKQLYVLWKIAFLAHSKNVSENRGDYFARPEKKEDDIRSLLLDLTLLYQNCLPDVRSKTPLNALLEIEGEGSRESYTITAKDIFNFFVSELTGIRKLQSGINILFESNDFGFYDVLEEADYEIPNSESSMKAAYDLSGFFNSVISELNPSSGSSPLVSSFVKVATDFLDRNAKSFADSTTYGPPPLLSSKQFQKIGDDLRPSFFTQRGVKNRPFGLQVERWLDESSRAHRLVCAFHQMLKVRYVMKKGLFKIDDVLTSQITEKSTVIEVLHQDEPTESEWLTALGSLPGLRELLAERDHILSPLSSLEQGHLRTGIAKREYDWYVQLEAGLQDKGIQCIEGLGARMNMNLLGLESYFTTEWSDKSEREVATLFAEKWVFRQKDDYSGMLNPMYFDFLRTYLAQHISQEEWLNDVFLLIDKDENSLVQHVVPFGRASSENMIRIGLPAYLALVRFSLFMKKHFQAHYKLKHDREIKVLDTVFGVKVLVDQMLTAWDHISNEESIAKGRGRMFNSIFLRFWSLLQLALQEISQPLPDLKKIFKNDPDLRGKFLAVLGDSPKELADLAKGYGLKDAMYRVLKSWTGTNKRNEILPFDPSSYVHKARLTSFEQSNFVEPSFTPKQLQGIDTNRWFE